MKRVLFIASQPFFQWRGSPIRLGFDLQALAELGWEVDFLTLPVGERREIPGVRIIRAPNVFLVRNVSIGPSLAKAAFDVVLLFMALWCSFRKRYDVVHGVEDAGALGVIVAGLSRSRLVFEKHSDPSSYERGFVRNRIMALYARVERFTVRHADAVIATGPGLARQVEAMGTGTPVHDISDVPSSLAVASDERVAALRTELRKASVEVLATYVGSFAVYQGIDLLFESIPVAAGKSDRIRFVIIGGTPSEIAARREWLSQRGVAGRVTFVGKVPPDELPNYLSASDILLSPRLAGVNTPLKLLDYLKAGRAIVATDTQSNRLILDESNAVIVRPEAGAFSAGILRLVDDEIGRSRLGAEGHKLIEEKYNFEEFKKRLAACYADLATTGARRAKGE